MPGKSHGPRSLVGYNPWGREESDTTERLLCVCVCVCVCACLFGASLVAQTVKRLPAMRETRVQFLGREDPLEKEMAIHSSILAQEISWTEESGGL